MSESFVFEVRGEVVGSARPRVTRHGTYMPAKTRRYRETIKGNFIEQGGRVMRGPLSVRIDVYRKLPKSRPKRMESEPDTYKPDVDNIAKNVLDALNGLAWEDDSQVVALTVRKWPRRRDDELIFVEIAEVEE